MAQDRCGSFPYSIDGLIMTDLKPTDISTEEIVHIMRLPIPELHRLLRRHRLSVEWTETKGEAFTEGTELVNALISITNEVSQRVEFQEHIEQYLNFRPNSCDRLSVDYEDDLPW